MYFTCIYQLSAILKRLSSTDSDDEGCISMYGRDYAGTIVAVFFFGIFSIGIKTGVSLMSIYWKSQ
eukprot:1162142-Pelagomonas_calceolata.AAC.24